MIYINNNKCVHFNELLNFIMNKYYFYNMHTRMFNIMKTKSN